MIIFLYGQDSYGINRKLNRIKQEYKTKNPSGLNLISLDFPENSLEDLEKHLISNSLIPEKKLIVLKNVFKIENNFLLDLFEKSKVDLNNDIILIAVSLESADTKNKLFNYLTKKPNLSEKFESLKIYDIKSWAHHFFNSLDLEIAGDALDYLISNCGPDLWRLDSEMRKVADYKLKGVITKSEIEKLIIPTVMNNAFELTDALANKNKKRALKVLEKSLNEGDRSEEILGRLAWQVRNLLRFKSNPKELYKLHPFVLEKIKKSAPLFSEDELKKFLSRVMESDLNLKTSNADEKAALSILIAEF